MKGFIKPVLALLFVALIVFLIYWLWQRQPKAINTQTPQTPINTVSEKNTNDQLKKSIFSLNLNDAQVFDNSLQKFSGTANPNSHIMIISNSLDVFLNTNDKGSFETEIKLDKGLNIINITELDKNLKLIQKQLFSFYLLDKAGSSKEELVYSGSIKSIFDNAITVSTISEDKKVKKNNQTQIKLSQSSIAVLPKNKQVEILKESDLRVGDYVIALGTSSAQSEIMAESIEVVRENKPNLTKKYSAVKIASVVKNKTFSSQNLENNNPMNFILDKNSKIYFDGKKTDEKAIAKEKKAVIFYTPQDKNIISSIYLLP